MRSLGRNDELLAELQRSSICPPVTIMWATNLDCIENEVQELKRFCLRKRHTTEKSSFRMTFLSPSNIEKTAARIEGQQYQE
jgi:hypothetical protein